MLQLNRYIIKRAVRCYSTALEEYTTVPQYPPILDPTPQAQRERKKQSELDAIKDVRTIEEKQIKLNMPKYYGFKCYHFEECHIPYNNLTLAQHITRTHIKQADSLCDYYKDVNVDNIVHHFQSKFQDALAMELDGYQTMLETKELSKQEIENVLSNAIIKQLNRTLINNMVQDCTHLLDAQIDTSPRVEALWYVGGMNPPKNVKKYRTGKGQEWRKHTENDPTDRIIRYEGKPVLTLRHNLPLRPIMSMLDASMDNCEVPKWIYDPRVVGTTNEYKHAANIPGFWPGETHQFGMISYHNRGHIVDRRFNDPQDDAEALHRQAILASYAWLHSQANFLGFNTFNDITYPLVNQAIITNGQLWSFYTYQMNTMLMHGKYINENSKVNVCFATPAVKLYEEYKDGKFIGFNDDVLKMIAKYYANTPEERMGVNMRPYLKQAEKVIGDYENVEKRQWLENEYKFLVANRPRYKLGYEMYHWEKIYKVDHKTRPMDARRRPFELNIKPYNRKLNERKPYYVPRALRPDLPRHKGRDAPEYFP